VLVIGSTLPDYTPSKMFACVLSGRPVLALLNAASEAARLGERCGNVRMAVFSRTPAEAGFASLLGAAARTMLAARDAPSIDTRAALADVSAEAFTRAQCELFDLAPQPRVDHG
jgi:hypothetical protein